MHKTLIRKCEECSHEWEIEWDFVSLPVANGFFPTGWDDENLSDRVFEWKLTHGNNDCESPLLIAKSEFDKD